MINIEQKPLIQMHGALHEVVIKNEVPQNGFLSLLTNDAVKQQF